MRLWVIYQGYFDKDYLSDMEDHGERPGDVVGKGGGVCLEDDGDANWQYRVGLLLGDVPGKCATINLNAQHMLRAVGWGGGIRKVRWRRSMFG